MNDLAKDTLDRLCINTIRVLAIDTVEKAKSGHPGLPLGAAPMAYVLWQNHLCHNPGNPKWFDRDRFVLSAGHGSALLYALLHLTGYALSMDDLKAFRQLGSITPGHPEYEKTPGVEATTGPLGQGAANAVGMAIAERLLSYRFNRPGHTIVDHFTYSLVSDGDMMEGIASEACSLAGHLKLGKLIFLYDSNNVSLDGPTSLAFSTENVAQRFQAYGWHVQHVADGNIDLAAIDQAITNAKQETSRPSLIIIQTTIGYGSPHKQGTSKAHGSPLGTEEAALTKRALGFNSEQFFFIPEEAARHFRLATERGKQWETAWTQRFEAYAAAFPELAEQWRQTISGSLPEGWATELPAWKPGESVATRIAAGLALNALAKKMPEITGGDADLSESTKTSLNGEKDFDGRTGEGRNLHFGVREHAMAAIANGISYHGGVRTYVSTFMVFSDYMKPAVRLAAMNRLPVVYAWTHDSVALGEDGPTHQPIEHLMALRIIPNMHVIRPMDANEAVAAWRFAMQNLTGPTALILTRQNVPVIDHEHLGTASGLDRGAYILAEAAAKPPQCLIIATGSEVQLALSAHQTLAAEGIHVRVIAMPCWEAFAAQSSEYQETVLPAAVQCRVSVEAGATFGWQRWTGDHGAAIGIDRFGLSAPGPLALKACGITVEHVVQTVKNMIQEQRP